MFLLLRGLYDVNILLANFRGVGKNIQLTLSVVREHLLRVVISCNLEGCFHLFSCCKNYVT